MRPGVNKGELVLALVFAALAALWIAKGATMPLWQGFAPDSGFLPLLYGVLLFVLAGAVLVQLVAAKDARPGEAIRKPLVILGALVATVGALPIAGFAISVFALLLFLYAAVERLPMLPSAVVSGATTGVLYLIFKTWLGVPLP
ncbi:MAG TPA: tripartite tricarboxylate transporter TctB family protein [Burkholderiales bacterium]|nr:tripartite tricarboxylate transporter TctB family protein [Burkholderiales bacterium]HSA69358.1 tripartite tricarboxylate transporter TctB family protein [Burkholderiales bacterium]